MSSTHRKESDIYAIIEFFPIQFLSPPLSSQPHNLITAYEKSHLILSGEGRTRRRNMAEIGYISNNIIIHILFYWKGGEIKMKFSWSIDEQWNQLNFSSSSFSKMATISFICIKIKFQCDHISHSNSNSIKCTHVNCKKISFMLL